MSDNPIAPYDAVVLTSFGGPEKPEDVLPFLQNVTRGRGIPDERLVEVGEHYYSFGGRSPINDQNRVLHAELQRELAARGIHAPLLWGNRNWHPFLTDTVRDFAQQTGARRFLAVTTSAYSSYSSCRQYREDFAQTVNTLGSEGLEISFDKTRQYYNHPGFAEATLGCVRQALEDFTAIAGPLDPAHHKILYVTHSIPAAMQTNSERSTAGYRAQHEQLIEWVNAELGEHNPLDSELVFCSRSGSPHTPWLEPDINDRIEELAATGTTGVIAVPVGFISDHMEVIYDLDTEAQATAAALGLSFLRAATVGISRAFVTGLVDLLLERAAQARGEEVPTPVSIGEALSAGSGACSLNCCEGSRRKATAPIWPTPEHSDPEMNGAI